MQSKQIAMLLPAGATPADPNRIVRGAKAIGELLGLSQNEANYHLRAGHVKGVRRLGKGYIGVAGEIIRLNAGGAGAEG